MVPAVIPLLLLLIPAMLTALSVVREKELGSIINFYVTPVTRLEFLLGKQLPYVVLGMANFLLLTLLAVTLFGVPLTGGFLTLAVATLLYVGAATAIGLLISTFTRSQIAAIFGTAVLTMLPVLLLKVKSLEVAMSITAKGQVTIPVAIREKAGLLPHTEVEFELDGDAVRIVRAKAPRGETRGERAIRLLRGSATVRMSTDEIMALTRGEE